MRSFASKRVSSQVFIVGIISIFTLLVPGTSALAVYYSPSVLNPNVFSYQNSTPTVSGETGALTQSIKFDTPPGRGNLQPNLSLDYNSQNTDQDSIVGVGWNLSIPYIARLNKNGSQNLYSSNAYFTSSLDGELSPATSSVVTTLPTGSYTVYLWGAGGGGGAAGVGGGSGSYVLYTASSTPGPQTITVGQGGGGAVGATGGAGGSGYASGGSGATVSGTNSGGGGGGGSSAFGTLAIAAGGGGGSNANDGTAGTASGGNGGAANGSNGGGGGGGAGTNGSAGSGITGGSGGSGGSTNTGTSGSGSTNGYPGGGSSAGASGNGNNGSNTGNGGAGSGGAAGGVSAAPNGTNGSAYSGSSPLDSGGGGGNGNTGTVGGNGAIPGGGGGGSYLRTSASGNGGNGLVVISYPTAQAAGYTCTGSTTISGSNTNCTYTSSGTFTVGNSVVTSVPPANNYYARVDSGSLRQYIYATSTNSWIVYDKTGTEYIFGSSTQSQQYDASSPGNVYMWMLEKEIDPNGNYIRYVYAKDHNQIYPSQIIYTGHNSVDGPMTVTFATSTRPDNNINFKPGFEVDTNWRIATITAAVNGNVVRQYNLSYTTGSNGTRSLLSAVQENGWDDNGVETTEPAMTFAYATSSASFLSQNQSSSCGVSPWAAADATGYGKNDSVFSYHDEWLGTYVVGVLSGGSGSETDVTAPTSTAYWGYTTHSASTINCPSETGTRLVSLTGNGKADIVKGVNNGQTGATVSGVFSNTSSAGSYSWSGTTPNGVIPNFQIINPGTGAPSYTTGVLGDVNGDGLPDYVYSVPGGYAGNATQTYLGNGSAWNPATTTIFVAPNTFTAVGPDCTNIQLVDVNGDGLPDWVYTDTTKTYVKLNTGTAWQSSPDSRWTMSTSTVYSSGGNCYDRGMRFVDINGDGLPDFVRSYNIPASTSGSPPPEQGNYQFVYINTGAGWATSTAYTVPTIIQGNVNSGVYQSTTDTELANFKGNGQQYQDVLATTTNPKGGSTEASYGLTAQSGTNPQLPYSLLTVTKLINHSSGSNEETDYSYAGGLQYLPSNTIDRKFAGFAVSTTTTPDATTVTYYSQGATSTAIVAGDQSDGYAQLNRPYRQDVFTPSGAAVTKTFYRWDTYVRGSGPFNTFVGLGRQLEQDYTAGGSHQDKDTDYTYSSTTDNLIATQNYGQVSGNSDGTFSTTSASNLRTTLISYAASSSINLFVPVEKTLFNNTNATTTDAQYFYDSLPFGQVSIGNQTKEKDLISTSTLTYASTTKAYNLFGFVASSTDRNGNLTSYVYDPFNLYPATTTNPLSQVAQYIFNYANGKTAQTVNSNGGIIKNSYDGVGRLAQVQQTNPTSTTTLDISKIFQYQDNASPPSMIHETDYLNAATTTDTYDYYDGLSRLIQERKSSAIAGTFNVTDSLYGTDGLLASKSLPYASSGASSTVATTTSYLFSNYTYDPLGRKLTIANAVGTTINTYNAWTTTVTDPLGHSKDSIVDAFGNLAQVVEHSNSSNATTTYAYDAANNLTNITDAAGNVRNFTFDALGNRLTAQDLHASGATTFGSTTYAYDLSGNLISQTDAKNQVITHTYDALNRMLTEAWTGKGTQVTDTYDSCTNGIGAICTASSTAAKYTYAYDVIGRTTQATTTVNGTGYGLGYTYDRQSNIASMTNADGSLLTYTYNTAGLTSAVNRKIGGVNSLVASLSNYSPANQVGQIVLGSGASTTYTYNPAQLYRLTRVLTLGAFTSTTTPATFTAYVWGGGGGGAAAGVGGGSGAYVVYSASSTPGTQTITVGQGGGGATGTTGGTGGTGYASGGTGASVFGANSGGGGGGGSSAFGTLAIASGGGGASNANDGTAGTASGGNGGTANGSNGGGGGGGAGTNGSAGSGITGGSGGSGGSTNTGTSGSGSTNGYPGGGSSAGASGNGNNGTNTGNGGAGSGGAAGGVSAAPNGTNGSAYSGSSPLDAGGGGGNGNTGTVGGNGAIPGGGGGGSYAQAYAAGNGGNGLVIISYPTAQASQYTCNGSTTISGTNTNCTYTSNGTFVIGTTTANTTNAALQDLNYTYDADGNILTRTDKSYSGGGQQVTYAYDNLNRLLTASTTLSNIYSYTQAFTYDALGNILTGPNGSYSYQGTGNANPDAVTKTALTVGASSPTIAYDNSAIAGNGTPASSLTFSYATNSNTNGLMIVSVDESATSSCTSDKVTGVTYNGRSLTDAGYYVRNSTTVNGAVKTYYGYSPATSTNNIVVSASASCILYATAATYTGVKQSGFPDASGTGNPLSDSGAVTLFQATTTTANNNAWAVLLGVPSTSGTATAGANTTLRQQQSGNLYYADSNGPVSPAGAIGLSWSMPSATNWAANYFALTPYISNPGTTTTTLYTYDNDGNLTGVGSSTTYTYDFDNRLTQSVINGVTTSYAYDPFGSRIMQATASSTTWYPNKFVSITNATSSTSATSTDYLYAGSTLFATIDQPLVSGAATGTPVTRYIHTDNLGSTNITSDSNQNRAQWFDYAPYGSVIASTNTGTTTDARQYIGQFSDASGLSYLNARYYNPTQSQFLTEDPVFWGQQNLGDPQSFNTYSYAEGNPITGSDPSGLYSLMQVAQGQATWGQYWGDVNQGAMIMGQNPGWNFAMNHPYTTGALTALGTYPAVVAGGEISAAYGMATFPGVSASFSAQQGFAGLVYSALAVDTTLGVPGFVNTLRGFSPRKPSSYFSAVTALTFGPVSAGVGGYPGAFSDAYQFAGLLNNTLGSAAINLFSNSVQTRSSAANSFNSSLGASGKVSAGGASVPNSNSVWMTPTGAAVTFGGKLVSPPPSGK